MKGILRDSFILFAITLISGLLLGYVHEITKEPIAAQKAKMKAEACNAVFADAADFTINTDAAASSLYPLHSFENGYVSEVLDAKNAAGEQLGYVMTVTSTEGYGGNITFLIGIQNDGTINGISITEISETAGLGMKAKDKAFLGQFAGKKSDTIKYTKSGAAAEDEIDAISSATITTNAMTNAVNGALEYYRELRVKGGVQ